MKKDIFNFYERQDWILVAIATVLVIMALRILMMQSAEPLGPGSMPIGQLQTEGWVKRRHAGTLQWEQISASDTVYLRDTIYTPFNTQATIQLKDKRVLELEPDSLVQLDDINKGQLQIALLYGDSMPKPMEALNDFQLRRKPLLAIPIPLETGTASLESRTKKALSDALGVETVAAAPALPVLPRPQFRDYIVQLVSPTPRTVSRNATVTFAWTPIPIPDAEYELNVSRDPAFKQSLWYPLKTNQVQADLMIKGDYYWRIKARHGLEETLSESRQVRIGEK